MSEQIKILVIDDEEMVCDVIALVLRRSDFDVRCVYSAGDALHEMSIHTFDLVLTDIIMPEMNGIELMEKVRAMENNVPFIAMTGGALIGTQDLIKQAEISGASTCLRKPVKKQEIIDAINETLALKPVS